MPKVTFIAFDGVGHTVDAASGLSLMRAAVDNGVAGIDADCGGQCACATCHVFIEPPWGESVGPRTPREDEMLNFAADFRPASRLACQITVTEALDGLTVAMPEGQH